MMKFSLIVLMSIFTVSAFAVDCSDAISNYDMKLCESKRLDEEDKRLNNLYKQLMAKNDKQGQAKLKAAQRAWISYRDAECAYASDSMRGGTGEILVELGCLAGKTKDRADEIQDYVEFQ